MPSPLLFILTGPSGVGKSTVAKKAFQVVGKIAKVITYTTRDIRKGEKNHQAYHFITHNQFEKKTKNNELFEWEKVYNDHFYGSPANPFETIPKGFDALLEIGVGGMKSYRESYTDAITIFLAPPNMATILDRIEKRGGQETNIDNRIYSAIEMLEQAKRYNYIVLNEDLDQAVNETVAIILAERCHQQRQEVTENLKKEVELWRKIAGT